MLNAGSDCIYIQDGNPSIVLDASVQVHNCAGKGLNAPSPKINAVSHARFYSNAGGDIGPNLNGSMIDYVGAWTPIMTATNVAGTPTYFYNTGSYERSGRQMTVRFAIQTTAAGGPAGNFQITGLPLLAGAIANDNGQCSITTYSGFTLGSFTQIGGNIASGTSTITLNLFGSGVAAGYFI